MKQLAIALTITLLGISACRPAGHVRHEPLSPIPRLTSDTAFGIKGHGLDPDLAMTQADRTLGLQGRQPPRDGLILLFPMNTRQSIWMPNCPVDLEAWVIDEQGVILEIFQLPDEPPRAADEREWQYHARLPRHRAKHASRIIWEFKSGTAAEMDVAPGDVIDGNWARLLANPG